MHVGGLEVDRKDVEPEGQKLSRLLLGYGWKGEFEDPVWEDEEPIFGREMFRFAMLMAVAKLVVVITCCMTLSLIVLKHMWYLHSS